MHIERFLRVSRAYLRATPVIAPRRELDGPGQLWGTQVSAQTRKGEALQRCSSAAILWTTSTHHAGSTSWPA
jgi:hypothetical protein